MDAQKFLKEIDKSIPPLILLTGDEYYYINMVSKKVKEKWFEKETESDVTSLPSEPSPEGLADIVYGTSFFSGHSLVIIEQSLLLATGKLADKQEEAYLKIYSNIPEHCRIIIKCEKPDKRTKKYKAITATAQLVECEKVKPYKLRPHIEQLAANYGCRFDAPAINLLMEYLSVLEDVSLYFIQQEVEKISLYAGSRKTWTKEDVETIFSNMTGISGFSLTKAMLAGDCAKALEVLRDQLTQGEQVLSIAGRVAWQVRNLWLAKSVLKNGGKREDVMAQTETAPFFVNELMSECKKVPEATLKKAMLELAALNRETRLGGRGVAHLEEIIAGFCKSI